MRGALLLVLLVAFAGCAGTVSTDTSSSSSAPAPSVPAAFTVGNDATGCFEAILVGTVELDHAQSLLPANWTAADAQVLLGTPAPTGRGAAWVNAYFCTQSEVAGGEGHGAEIGVLVQQPRLAGNATGNTTAGLHVYQLAQVASGRLQEVLEPLGLPVLPAQVEWDTTTVGAAMEGSVTVANGTSTLYSFSFAAVQDAPFTGTANFWHETPDGTSFFHFSLTAIPVLRGSVTECQLSGPAADVMGATTCSPGQGLAMIAPQQEWQSELRWLPGVHAGA
jgi:uncharacterized protein YceK